MTFPGVVPVAVSGEEGQQEEKVPQARDQEVSFEALSMRPTEVSSLIVLFTWAGSTANARPVRTSLLPFWWGNHQLPLSTNI